MYRSPVRRAVFIVASLIVPIIANGFRALGIVALGHYLGSAQAVEADHVLYGWIFFSIVILVLIALGLPFREDHRPLVMERPSIPPTTGHMRATLVGVAALIVLAGIGPAIAIQLDRVPLPGFPAELATLVPGHGCSVQPTPLTEGLGSPGRVIVQRVRCADGIVELTIEVFSPRTTASRLIAEQRRLTLLPGAEDVQSHPLQIAHAPARTWRMVETPNPFHLVATSLWVEGKPTQGGLGMRLRQALNSIVGSRFFPVLVVVTPEADPLGDGSNRAGQAERNITTFLQSQADLTNQIARLTGSDSGRP